MFRAFQTGAMRRKLRDALSISSVSNDASISFKGCNAIHDPPRDLEANNNCNSYKLLIRILPRSLKSNQLILKLQIFCLNDALQAVDQPCRVSSGCCLGQVAMELLMVQSCIER